VGGIADRSVGGILGAVVFHAVLASTREGFGYQLVQFLISVAIGVAGAVIGVAVLWFCLRKLDLGEVLGTTSQLACVVAVAADGSIPANADRLFLITLEGTLQPVTTSRPPTPSVATP
jgi:hypothetical protein